MDATRIGRGIGLLVLAATVGALPACAAKECANGADIGCIRAVASQEDLELAIAHVGPCYSFGASLCEKVDQCGELAEGLDVGACITWWVAEVCAPLDRDPEMMTHCTAWAQAIDCPYFELGAAYYNNNAQPCEAEYPHPLGSSAP